MASSISSADPREAIRARAFAEGFDVVRFTSAAVSGAAGARLKDFLKRDRHGSMHWMAANADRRADPQTLWPDARSIVVLGMNYAPDGDPFAALAEPERAAISVYAGGDDYHDVLKKKLRALATYVAGTFNADVKLFVDTAPVMEKPIAEAAGVGWQGKHTNLVSREFGSWLFLGSIFTTLVLAPDESEADHCGQCRRCLDICPTNAFPEPYQLDARRCISYLTIEHKGPIAREFRKAIGNRIYGCDDCLAVCPWNKFAKHARETRFRTRAELVRSRLEDLARLDDSSFRDLFRGSPIKRIGRDRFLRNVLIAIGNAGDPRLAREAERLLADSSPLVRGMAVWALSRLLAETAFNRLAARCAPLETDSDVQEEWVEASSEMRAAVSQA